MTVAQKNAEIAKGIKINDKISQNHKYGDEIALLRKEIKRLAIATKKPLSPEFEAYYNEVESVKEEVKEELGI